ncbi:MULTISPECIES: LacI family DNA-binding transcriptional regulator [unclassified Pantoea]|uniref:LacI family DNA-binding transcriptional regulator n=1 Tax=unclassified Pantoea TaxID=2630326 RepID=UPI0023DA0D14|nr:MULTISPECIES: LacI family DNA-binding transcriptional regulator [unclassified Pantoea]MDF2042702.1 LacI family DNA-binding transcriptional regulator [Pantoea sp. Cr_R14]MDF2068933.1 LacI family DNA-binding transcriptional regulator [Pantoea sp. Cr_R13]MDF2079670.1 LacI family DNA-binding transcriptional regulator [Pantoea sp. Cr_R21]
MSLKAIATVLGLSVTTVSRALNGYQDVAHETRKHIEEEAQRRGYRPNAAARRLKTGRANAVGLIYPISASSLSGSDFSDMLLSLDHHLACHDINLLLLMDKQQSQSTLTHLLRSGAVDALIVGHTTPDDSRLHALIQANFRFLALGRSDLPPTYAWLDVDHFAGSQMAVSWSLAQGRQRIAWLGSNEHRTRVRERRQGYLTALGDVAPYAMAAVSPSRRAGYQQTRQWLAEAALPEVIITDCAVLAEGAALALQQTGRSAGERAILLAGWEGLPRDAILDHPIVAIRQATPHQAGEQVAEMVIQLINGAPPETLQTLWQPWLQLPV